jgi:HK97 family phage major capsid protein
MKTPEIIQLERDRLVLIDEARGALRSMEKETDSKKLDELDKRHADLMRQIDENKLDIEAAELVSETARNRPDQSGEGRGQDDDRPLITFPSLWTDAKGKPVTVLERNQPMAKRNDLGVGFGDYVRALVNGPRTDAEKRALSEGTASEGGFTVPAPVSSEFIDKLRAETCAIRAGARTVPMSSASLSMARVDTDPTVTWRLENSLIDDSDPVFSQLLLEAKACAGLVKVSVELLKDSVNINEVLTNCFVEVMARELDRVALWNDGTDDGPVGAAATSGINEVSMGTNGAALTNYDKLIDTIYEMHLDNAGDPTAQIMHPRTQAALAKLKDSQNNPLTVPDMVAKIPRMATTSASIAETQGSAVNASSILYGNFRNMFIGIRDEVSITILRERYADYGQVGFLVWMRADVQLAHKASFSRLKGIIPA